MCATSMTSCGLNLLLLLLLTATCTHSSVQLHSDNARVIRETTDYNDEPPPPPGLPNFYTCGISAATHDYKKGMANLPEGYMPWLVAVMFNEDQDTARSGSLVTQRHVITGAKRLYFNDASQIPASQLSVVLGSKHIYNYSTEHHAQLIQIKQVIVHPTFNYTLNKNLHGLAVLVLEKSALFSLYVQPVCAWSPLGGSLVGRVGSGSGWQTDDNNKKMLQHWELPVVSQAECLQSNSYFARKLSNDQFCAGLRDDDTGPCNANAGQVYFRVERANGEVRWVLRGITNVIKRHPEGYCDQTLYFTFYDVNHYARWLKNMIFPETPEEECGETADHRDLIRHGTDTEPGDWPWLVAVFKINTKVHLGLDFSCGGVLVTRSHVLTAGHCINRKDYGPIHYTELQVIAGKYDLRSFNERFQLSRVVKITIHPDYLPSRKDADLAVLLLAAPVQITPFVRPVCSWDATATLANQRGTVVGWGSNEHDQFNTNTPRLVTMPLVTNQQCLESNSRFEKYVTHRTYCAGNRDGSGACNGDSGSGMYLPRLADDGTARWMLRGLVSRSLNNRTTKMCNLNEYVIFTDVTKFTSWINDVTSNT